MKMRRPGQTKDYILEADRESDEPTVFEFHQLSWKEMASVNKEAALTMDQAIQVNAIYVLAKSEDRELTDDEKKRVTEIAPMGTEMIHRLNMQHSKAVKLGLEKIKNLRDENNQPLEISIEEFEKFADRAVVRELGTAIIQFSGFNEKNSKN